MQGTEKFGRTTPEPNPEAIAWYVAQAEAALGDLQVRVQAIRSRAGQLAGFAAAVIVLVGGNADRIVGGLVGAPRIVAGVALLAATALFVASIGSAVFSIPLRSQSIFDVSGREVANYATARFTHEPDLWRVHVRTIRGHLISIDATTRAGDRAVKTLRWAGLLFFAGLVSAAFALAILVTEVTF